jgi:hypothetical protein
MTFTPRQARAAIATALHRPGQTTDSDLAILDQVWPRLAQRARSERTRVSKGHSSPSTARPSAEVRA